MKIKTRVLISAVISIGLVVILGLLLSFLQEKVRASLEADIYINSVVEEVFELNVITNEYVNSRSKSSEFRWETQYKWLTDIIGSAEFDDPRSKEIWARVVKHHRLAKDIFEQIKENADSQKVQTILLDQLTFRSQAKVAGAFALKKIIANDLGNKQWQSEVLLLVFIILLILVAIFNTIQTIQTIVLPIGKLHEGSEIIGKGNFEHKIEVNSKNELGNLAIAFNHMTANLMEVTASRDDFDKEITMRKKSEEQLKITMLNLQQSNQELEQFAYVASHDLQEPLRMVSSFTQLLERRYKDKLDADANDFIHFAVDGANRMQKLINDLLDYSRITSRGKEFDSVDLTALLGQAVSNLHEQIMENGALITNGDLPALKVDESQMIRVFQNLIENAIKYKKKDELPKVHISCKEIKGFYEFAIKDNGIGIDMQFHDRVFIIFQRLHAKDEYRGTGIGLSICKRIIERHGGRIWFDSKVNEGTTFYFTLKK